MYTEFIKKKSRFAACVTALAVTYCLVCPEPAHAGYLDPGSGSTLVQGIVAAIAACKRFWRRITGIFRTRQD